MSVTFSYPMHRLTALLGEDRGTTFGFLADGGELISAVIESPLGWTSHPKNLMVTSFEFSHLLNVDHI